MKKQIKIKAGDIVEWDEKYFDVVKYNGFLYSSRKGELYLVEQKSMLEGATDYFLKDIIKGKKITIIKLIYIVTKNDG